ncbi:MAG: hypothetical protein WCT07_00850 [Candidatus Paceibacterota bacterium]
MSLYEKGLVFISKIMLAVLMSDRQVKKHTSRTGVFFNLCGGCEIRSQNYLALLEVVSRPLFESPQVTQVTCFLYLRGQKKNLEYETLAFSFDAGILELGPFEDKTCKVIYIILIFQNQRSSSV